MRRDGPRTEGVRRIDWLSRAKICETGMLHELLHVLQGEDLASSGKNQLLHVLQAYAKAASGNTGDHFLRIKPVVNEFAGRHNDRPNIPIYQLSLC